MALTYYYYYYYCKECTIHNGQTGVTFKSQAIILVMVFSIRRVFDNTSVPTAYGRHYRGQIVVDISYDTYNIPLSNRNIVFVTLTN